MFYVIRCSGQIVVENEANIEKWDTVPNQIRDAVPTAESAVDLAKTLGARQVDGYIANAVCCEEAQSLL